METIEQLNKKVDPMMRRIVERNMLKYAVGRQLFCKACQCIMDARRAVQITVYSVKPGDKDKQVRHVLTVCAKCYEGRVKPNMDMTMKTLADNFPAEFFDVEILDGRELWKRPSRAKKAGAK